MAKIKRKQKKKPISKFQKATKFFSDLNDLQLLEFEQRLKDGDTYNSIKDWLKEEGCFLLKSDRTLYDAISLYNMHVLKPKIMTAPKNRSVYKDLDDLKEKVNSLQETSELVIQQKRRLLRILEMERSVELSSDGVLTKAGKDVAYQARKEIKLMSDLVDRLVNIQMKTGHIKIAPKYISGEVVQDEEDPTRITFNIKEDFMENLTAIESELEDIIDLKTIEKKIEKKRK